MYFVSKNIQFYTTNLVQYNKEKDFEIFALKLHILSNSFTIICIYISPTGNLQGGTYRYHLAFSPRDRRNSSFQNIMCCSEH